MVKLDLLLPVRCFFKGFFSNMLLVIDVGNTNTVFAVFDKDKIKGQWRIATNPKMTADEYAINLTQLLSLGSVNIKKIRSVIVSSVVPQGVFSLKKFCKNYFGCDPFIVGDINIGVEIRLDKPSEVGSDRLVNAVAAYNKFGGDVIVVDFGTATTFDVIGTKGEYMGGVISPGINLSVDALNAAAAKLPEVDVAKPEKVIGKSTVGAMQSGIYWGYVSLIEGVVARIQGEYGKKMKVLATGGLAPLFFKAIESIEYLEPDLTIEGLKLIYDANNGK